VYGDLVWSLARRFLRRDADAEDAVQDIFIDLWASAPRFNRRIGSEGAFVSTIARRRFIDRLREKERRPAMESLDDEDFGEIHHPVIVPRFEEESELANVERLLQSMLPEYRQIISLSFGDGYTHVEIARRLNIPLGTVKTRVRRGLSYIRGKLNTETDCTASVAV